MTTTHAAAGLPGWLADLPKEDGFVHISRPRRYAFDEGGYDAYYSSDPANLMVGRGVVAVAREAGGPTDGAALEVGCGTGLVSLGLIEQNAYPLTVITDPSPEFLKITQKKVRAHSLREDRVCYAVLMGEEIDRLPESEFSLIVLRSTLHHILDVDAFIAGAARALRPGGVLTFQEPCSEGYLLMGAVVGTLPALAAAAGSPLSAEQERQVRLFADSMAYYTRRDLDKTEAEDKHLFKVDEIMKSGERAGLSFTFHPNTTFDKWTLPRDSRPGPETFGPFFRSYAKHCMAWNEDLLALFDRFLAPACRYVDEASSGGGGPYMHGVFAGKKT
jgi:ubiquinone/menaquinone biosynthesis C-methylase UbiE